jgi:hypothetical protein
MLSTVVRLTMYYLELGGYNTLVSIWRIELGTTSDSQSSSTQGRDNSIYSIIPDIGLLNPITMAGDNSPAVIPPKQAKTDYPVR